MSGSLHHRHNTSATKDLDEIIDRYSSPAISTSSPMRERHSESTPGGVDEDDTRTSLPSSPPVTTPSSLLPYPSLQHRRSSTHSGYLNRAQIFGRSSIPVPSSSPLPLSTALERIEARHLSGLSTPDSGFFSSPLTNTESKKERFLHNRSSLQSLKGRQMGGSSTPNPSTSRLSGRISRMSLREKFSKSPRDEWMEADTPEPYVANNSIRSGSMSNFLDAPSYGVERRATATEQTSQSTVITVAPRGISTAEAALRGNLSKVSSSTKTPHTRQTSWTRRIFKRRDPGHVSPETSQSYQSTTSEADSIQSSNVEPQTPAESRSDFLACDEARIDAEQEDYDRLADEGAPDDDVHKQDRSCADLQGAPDGKGSVASLSASTADSYDSVPSSPSASRKLSIESAQDLPFKQPVKFEQQQHHPATAIKPSEPSVEGLDLSCMSPVTTFDQPPISPNHGFVLASPRTVSPQDPLLPEQNIAISPVQTTISMIPLAPHRRRGLTFAGANAIIHGFISLAVMRVVLLNLGDHIRAETLAHDMSIAFTMGMLICAVLHCVLGGRIQRIPENLFRAVGYSLGAAYGFVIDGFRNGRRG